MESSVSRLELLLPIPFRFPRLGQLSQPRVVNDSYRLTFNDYVEAFLPSVAPGGENHVRLGP